MTRPHYSACAHVPDVIPKEEGYPHRLHPTPPGREDGFLRFFHLLPCLRRLPWSLLLDFTGLRHHPYLDGACMCPYMSSSRSRPKFLTHTPSRSSFAVPVSPVLLCLSAFVRIESRWGTVFQAGELSSIANCPLYAGSYHVAIFTVRPVTSSDTFRCDSRFAYTGRPHVFLLHPREPAFHFQSPGVQLVPPFSGVVVRSSRTMAYRFIKAFSSPGPPMLLQGLEIRA